MQQNTHSESFIKKRRFYTFLPLIVLPFITIFYGVAVGKINKKSGQAIAASQGLNTSLPDAIINQHKLVNKLSYYDKAADDSLRRALQQKKDPYFQDTLPAPAESQADLLAELPARKTSGRKERQEPGPDAVYRKLDALNAALSKASGPEFKAQDQIVEIQDDSSHQQLRWQLEKILQNSQQDPEQGQEDQELKALGSMLDKIIRIQNPQLASQNMDQTNVKRNVSAVTTSPVTDSINQLDPPALSESLTATTGNGFYSLDEPVSGAANTAIQAIIEKNPRLVSGSTVKLRLTSDIFIQGELVPTGTFLFGQASLSGERLDIQIQSVRHQNALFQVNLKVYDMDGQPGIYIPGAISRDVAKQSAAQAATGISIGSLDNSLGAQAADATIQATRTLLSRKAKLQQVSIREGYQVLLYDKNGPGIITR